MENPEIDLELQSGDEDGEAVVELDDDRVVFFDVETYPNLFVICWKFLGDDKVVKMINPQAHEVAALFRLKLVGRASTYHPSFLELWCTYLA